MSKPAEGETPRTDAEVDQLQKSTCAWPDAYAYMLAHARQLERELTAALSQSGRKEGGEG